MRYKNSSIAALVAAMAMAAFATTASAETLGAKPIVVDGYKYGGGIAVGADKNMDALRALIRAADAMGQLRDNQYGGSKYLVLGDTTNALRIVGKGTWNGEMVDVRLDWDYRVPGVRFQIDHPDKSQDIMVAAGGLAWDEGPAGIYKGPAKTSVNDRLILAYLMPSAVILTARDAADKMKLSLDNQAHDVLTIPVPTLGADLVATLDAIGHPVHTEINMGGKLYTADFGQFLQDRMDMEVKFPHQVKMQVDGKTFADWELEYHQTNPYLIFPVPSQVAAK